MSETTRPSSRWLTLIILSTLSTAACHRPVPCPDCDDSAPDMQDEPLPDLPCGGADLMTDPYNCGTCGTECGLWFPGTEYEAGSCQEGVCMGPGWGECTWEAAGSTCGEVCATFSSTCVPAACAGYTALLIFVGGVEVDCGIPFPDPYATLNGPCDEPIPWEDPDEAGGSTYVICCCA